jgi:hypothetical protein
MAARDDKNPQTGYAIAKSLDGSRKIEAKDCGQGMPGVRRLAHLDLGIEWIDAACSDPDEDLARPRLRTRNGRLAEWSARGLQDRSRMPEAG